MKTWPIPRLGTGVGIPPKVTRDSFRGFGTGSFVIFERKMTGIPAGLTVVFVDVAVATARGSTTPLFTKRLTSTLVASAGQVRDDGAVNARTISVRFTDGETAQMGSARHLGVDVMLSDGTAHTIAYVIAKGDIVPGNVPQTVGDDPILAQIIVTPVNPVVFVGATQQFIASGLSAEGLAAPATGGVWTVGDATRGSISVGGLYTATAPGFNEVRYTIGPLVGDSDIDNQSPPLEWPSGLVLQPPDDLGAGAQTIVHLVGPSGLLGETAAVEGTDPTVDPDPVPVRLVHSATSRVTYGNVLGTTFAGVDGWSVIFGINPDAADIAGTRAMFSKDDDTGRVFGFLSLAGLLTMETHGVAGSDEYKASVAIAVGVKTVGFTFNPSLARVIRGKLYVNGLPIAFAHTPTGSDGALNTNASLLVHNGRLIAGFLRGFIEGGLPYVWNRPLTDGEMVTADTKLGELGWAP